MTNKTRLLLALLTSCLFIQAYSQQIISYSDQRDREGLQVISMNEQGIEVSFDLSTLTIGDLTVEGENMKTLEIPGVFLPNDEGCPNLPGTGRYIAMPAGAIASLEILEVMTEVIPNIAVAPAPRIPKENEDGLEYRKNEKVYSQDALYPAQFIQVSEKSNIRGVDVVMLGITPFQYNPVSKTLTVYKHVRARVNFHGGNGQFGDNRLRSRWFDPLLQDMLLNAAMLPKVNYNKHMVNTEDDGFEYLIIVPNDAYFSQWADSIKEFRTKQGIITGIKTLADVGGNTTTAIETYLNNAFNTWTIPPVACLLIGDYGTNAANTITSPIWDSYCVSDNIYGDVNSDDMPDIVMARMTAQNAAQLEVMVRKFIDYERNPPVNPGFYNNPVTALGWQTERWFQVCSEVIRGFWENSLGKTPVRINAIYDGNPSVDPWSTATNTNTVINYFGPSGLNYIPATPQSLGGWSGGTPAMVTSALNEGAFMLQHRDHGFEAGWGEPAYTSTEISDLTNTDLSFIMSINCLTGKYNHGSEVFAEKFHRYTYNNQPSGALGIIAASEVSYSFVNDAYIWGVYDNLWPEFMPAYGSTPTERGILPAFGNAAGKYFLQQSSWPYNSSNKEVTYNLFHHHGDAFLTVYSEMPQSLTVNHDPVIYASVTSFDVTANPGSLICLSLNGEILGTATGTGSPVTISIPGNQLPPDVIDVVVTLQNYYRYEGQVLVIPPTGPYVIKDQVAVNDINGNNNGQADFGENILLNVSMKNVGVLVSANTTVTLQCADPAVTITDGTEVFGDIPPAGSVSLNDAFALTVAPVITDNYPVSLTLTATNGTDTWTSYSTLHLFAPDLKTGTIQISDPLGNNNGRLDPGETVSVIITTLNSGHCEAVNTISGLVSADTSVQILTAQINLDTIAANGQKTATFTIQVSPFAMQGDNIPFTFTAASGSYQTVKYFIQTIGIVAEDWESNTFTHYPWINNSNVPWTITTSNPYEGQYCARSGTIGNNASTTLSISMDVVANDSISFYRRVSSEANYDYLKFFIDGELKGQWSGNVAWGRVVFPVATGSHTFQWTYSKDGWQTGGSDAAWIDYIIFPPFGAIPLQVTALASPATICLGNTAQLSVNSTGGMQPFTYQWAPAASLNNATLANPVASPTTTTTYTVTVTDQNNQAVISTVVVNVNSIPVTPASPTASQTQVCQGSGSILASTTAVTGAVTYNWLLTPAAAGNANGSGTSAWINWNAAFSGNATLQVRATNACGSSDYSSALSFTVLPKPNVTLNPLSNVCVNASPFTLSGGVPAGGTFTGTGVSNNSFSPATAGAGTWNIAYTWTDGNGCSNTASQPIFVDPCIGLDDVSGDATIMLFPNPGNGLITLSLKDATAAGIRIKAFTTTGTAIREWSFEAGAQHTHLLDLSDQAEGYYLLQIETGNRTFYRKVLLTGK
ncbi:MAG TPA: C25 family cysteine peptidase [Bacteroidales bacterium]|nr:C25 family cysteine peptidase [Bacteroidales bacterium]HSA42265.1 C25 family cysteine peptidase [Bacteroidales bacterium]